MSAIFCPRANLPCCPWCIIVTPGEGNRANLRLSLPSPLVTGLSLHNLYPLTTNAVLWFFCFQIRVSILTWFKLGCRPFINYSGCGATFFLCQTYLVFAPRTEGTAEARFISRPREREIPFWGGGEGGEEGCWFVSEGGVALIYVLAARRTVVKSSTVVTTVSKTEFKSTYTGYVGVTG